MMSWIQFHPRREHMVPEEAWSGYDLVFVAEPRLVTINRPTATPKTRPAARTRRPPCSPPRAGDAPSRASRTPIVQRHPRQERHDAASVTKYRSTAAAQSGGAEACSHGGKRLKPSARPLRRRRCPARSRRRAVRRCRRRSHRASRRRAPASLPPPAYPADSTNHAPQWVHLDVRQTFERLGRVRRRST